MNLRRAKRLRRAARLFAQGRLPERKLLGGRHTVHSEERTDAKSGVVTKRYRVIGDRAVNDRMTVRGIYRALKREFRLTGRMPT